jgi:hypothetical protein
VRLARSQAVVVRLRDRDEVGARVEAILSAEVRLDMMNHAFREPARRHVASWREPAFRDARRALTPVVRLGENLLA